MSPDALKQGGGDGGGIEMEFGENAGRQEGITEWRPSNPEIKGPINALDRKIGPPNKIGIALRVICPDLPDEPFDIHRLNPSPLKIVQARRECNRSRN